MKHEPVPAVGVSALIFDRRGRVLLIRRARPPARGKWHAPGGRLEAGEALTSAVLREVREETGIEGVRLGPIAAVVERRIEGFHYLIVDFLGFVDGEGPPPRAADDALAAAWVPPEEWSDYELAEGLAPILTRARQLWRGRHGGLVDVTGQGTDFLADSWRRRDESSFS
ncbi:MAG: hypothetical protein Kow0060_01170 [Methylohalobius crimeensis]